MFTILSVGCRGTEFESADFRVRQVWAGVSTGAHFIHVTVGQLHLLHESLFPSL